MTNTGKRDGVPVIQGRYDPNPGYYVSTTSLIDKNRRRTDPNRYVNSNKAPYIVLPLQRRGGAKVGDFSVVVNKRNGRIAYAIFADVGPKNRIGEGSIALAKTLGIDHDPRFGGIENNIIYHCCPVNFFKNLRIH